MTDHELHQGEYRYVTRGIGNNWLPCFICGYEKPDGTCQHDMAAFARSKEEGEAIVALFQELGLRASLKVDEARVRYQVKVGVCDKHLIYLKCLQATVVMNGNKIDRVSLEYIVNDDRA